MAFTLAGDGGQQAWITATDGTGDARQVTDLEGSVHVDSWAPDGSALAFHHHVPSRLEIVSLRHNLMADPVT